MQIIGKNGLSGFIKILLMLVFAGGSVIFLGLPFLLKWYLTGFVYRSDAYAFLLVFLYFTGFFCLWIVYEMNKIFNTLNRKDPFRKDNVKSLERMSISSFIIGAAYVVKIICYNSFLTMIITMIFIILGLFLVVLAELFKQAVRFKEENELTI